MLRRQFFRLIALGLGLFSFRQATADDPLPGQLNPTPGVTQTDLEQTLKFGLKARRPVEFQFIHDVVELTKSGDIPLSMVQTSFLWARRHKPWQYPYFEKSLKELAAKQGITVVPTGAGY